MNKRTIFIGSEETKWVDFFFLLRFSLRNEAVLYFDTSYFINHFSFFNLRGGIYTQKNMLSPFSIYSYSALVKILSVERTLTKKKNCDSFIIGEIEKNFEKQIIALDKYFSCMIFSSHLTNCSKYFLADSLSDKIILNINMDGDYYKEQRLFLKNYPKKVSQLTLIILVNFSKNNQDHLFFLSHLNCILPECEKLWITASAFRNCEDLEKKIASFAYDVNLEKIYLETF